MINQDYLEMNDQLRREMVQVDQLGVVHLIEAVEVADMVQVVALEGNIKLFL